MHRHIDLIVITPLSCLSNVQSRNKSRAAGITWNTTRQKFIFTSMSSYGNKIDLYRIVHSYKLNDNIIQKIQFQHSLLFNSWLSNFLFWHLKKSMTHYIFIYSELQVVRKSFLKDTTALTICCSGCHLNSRKKSGCSETMQRGTVWKSPSFFILWEGFWSYYWKRPKQIVSNGYCKVMKCLKLKARDLAIVLTHKAKEALLAIYCLRYTMLGTRNYPVYIKLPLPI